MIKQKNAILLNTSFTKFQLPVPGRAQSIFQSFHSFPSQFGISEIRICPNFFNISRTTSDDLIVQLHTGSQHCKNALEIAKFLKNHEAVSWVNYPGLEDNENHEMAEKYLNGNYGGIVGFGIKGGLEEGKKFIESVKLLSHVANIGDAKSLVIHPASTTHSNMTEEEQLEGGITPDFIRMSVGIEDAEDLIADIDQALKKSIS